MKNYLGIAKSEIGSSHKRTGRECQDASGYFGGAKYSAVIVSDGHGGNKHFRSRIGATLIKEIVETSLPDFAKSVCKQTSRRDVDDILKWYEKYLVFAWREEVDSELIINPIDQDERLSVLTDNEVEEVVNNPYIAYGATMLLAIYCGDFLYLSQLGDGDIRILTRKGIEDPIQDDERLRFGRTTSLCNTDALNHMRSVVIPSDSVRGCFISSDGVRNSFDSEENYNKFVRAILSAMVDDKNTIAEEVNRFLPTLSENGSGDDVSVAAIIRRQD